MTGTVAEAVDTVIRQARTLLGADPPASPPKPAEPSPLPHPDGWQGTAADHAAATSTGLHQLQGQLTTAQIRTVTALATGTEISRTGHAGLDVIETGWQDDKAALGPFADTTEGQVALTNAGTQRIAETQALVTDIANQYGAAADDVNAATSDLPPTDPEAAPAPQDGSPEPDEDNATDTDLPDQPGDPFATTAPQPTTVAPPQAGGSAGMPTAAMMPQGLPGGAGMPSPAAMPASAGMPAGGGAGLTSLLQPLSQAAMAADHHSTSADSDSDDHDIGSTGSRVVQNADRALGLPYIWGGGNADAPTGGGFDCSGLAQWAVAQATEGQVILPRTTYEQIHVGNTIDPRDARPGDLVFSNFSKPGVPEHVQIYAGDGKVIEAQQRGTPVKYSTAPEGPITVKRVT
jgi:cell wall-associated NlpC family hydrolase